MDRTAGRRGVLALRLGIALAILVCMFAGCTSAVSTGAMSSSSSEGEPISSEIPSAEESGTAEPAPAEAAEPVLVPVFAYHHVMPAPSNFIAISPETFRAHLETIRAHGYTPVTVTELHLFVRGEGELPQRPVMLTFDDGWNNQYRYALPLLEEFGYKATFFIYPRAIGSGKFMSAAEIREIAQGGHDIQSHTWSHASMLRDAGESDSTLALRIGGELDRAAEWIERETGSAPVAVAYPYGAYDGSTGPLVRDGGLSLAFAVDEGVNMLESEDPFRLKRFSVFRADSQESFVDRLTGCPLDVDGLTPSPGAIVTSDNVHISGWIRTKLDPGSVILLVDNEEAGIAVEPHADGSTTFEATVPAKSGYRWLTIRAPGQDGLVYYEGWGFSMP